MSLPIICVFVSMYSAFFMNHFVYITSFEFRFISRLQAFIGIMLYSFAIFPLSFKFDSIGSDLLIFLSLFYFLNFLPFVIFAKGPLAGKMYCFFLQNNICFVVAILASFIVQIILPYDSDAYVIAFSALTVVSYAAITYFMYKHGNRLFSMLFQYIKGSMWSFIAVLPYLSFLIIKNMYFEKTTGVPMQLTGEISYILMPVIIMGGLIALTASILTVQKRIADQSELKMAQSVISSGHEYYDKLTDMTEKLQRQRHDYKFQLRAVQALLENDKDAKIYLETITSKLEETYIKDYCHSRVINAILSSYSDKCRSDGIDFFTQIEMPEDLPVDEYELSIIIGNLLENALTACQRTLEGERRYIDIVMRRHDKNFGIMVENSFDGVLVQTPTGFASTKTGASEPVGLGIESIKAVAKKNGGEYIPNWDRKKFSAYVVMKLKL